MKLAKLLSLSHVSNLFQYNISSGKIRDCLERRINHLDAFVTK